MKIIQKLAFLAASIFFLVQGKTLSSDISVMEIPKRGKLMSEFRPNFQKYVQVFGITVAA